MARLIVSATLTPPCFFVPVTITLYAHDETGAVSNAKDDSCADGVSALLAGASSGLIDNFDG